MLLEGPTHKKYPSLYTFANQALYTFVQILTKHVLQLAINSLIHRKWQPFSLIFIIWHVAKKYYLTFLLHFSHLSVVLMVTVLLHVSKAELLTQHTKNFTLDNSLIFLLLVSSLDSTLLIIKIHKNYVFYVFSGLSPWEARWSDS